MVPVTPLHFQLHFSYYRTTWCTFYPLIVSFNVVQRLRDTLFHFIAYIIAAISNHFLTSLLDKTVQLFHANGKMRNTMKRAAVDRKLIRYKNKKAIYNSLIIPCSRAYPINNDLGCKPRPQVQLGLDGTNHDHKGLYSWRKRGLKGSSALCSGKKV